MPLAEGARLGDLGSATRFKAEWFHNGSGISAIFDGWNATSPGRMKISLHLELVVYALLIVRKTLA